MGRLPAEILHLFQHPIDRSVKIILLSETGRWFTFLTEVSLPDYKIDRLIDSLIRCAGRIQPPIFVGKMSTKNPYTRSKNFQIEEKFFVDSCF